MRYSEAHAAKSGSVPLALFGRKSVRMAMSAAVAAVIGVAPALVYSSPASAASGDLTFSVSTSTGAENHSLTVEWSYKGTGGDSYTLAGAPVGLGGAVVTTDYTIQAGAQTALTNLADGTTGSGPIEGSFTVSLLEDKVYEPDEQFKITATGDNSDVEDVTLTIQDGPAPDFTLTSSGADTPIQEMPAGTPPAQATITATVGDNTWTLAKDYVVNLSAADVSAKAATDYGSVAPTLTIAKGGTRSNETTIDIESDGLKDSALIEQFSVFGSGPAAGAPKSTSVKIKDDATDATDPVLTIANAASAKEGASSSFTVTADHGSDTDITATWTSLDNTTPAAGHGVATPGVDFTYVADATDASRKVTVPATTTGTPSKTATISIPLKEDSTYEQAEDFSIGLSSPSGATLGTTKTATGTILDKSDLTATVTPISVAEGNDGRKAVTFTMTLSQPALKPVTVAWKTADLAPGPNSATAGLDYAAGNSTVTFPAGSTTQTFTVDVMGDTVDESDESFNIVTTSEFTTYAGTTTAIKITDDDAAPTFTFDNVTIDEGNTPHAVLVPIKLSNASSSPITFDLTDASSGAGAASDTFSASTVGSGDYMLLTKTPPTTVTVQAGTTEGYAVVLLNGDEIYEKSEWAKFTATPDTATVTGKYLLDNAPKTSTLTINNDDKAPDLEINNVSGNEGETVQVTGTVTGVSDSATNLTVVFEGGASDGKRAADANDFTNPGATPITIDSGVVPGTVLDVAKVALSKDATPEPAETIRVTGYGQGNVGTVTEGVITIASQTGTDPGEPGEPGEGAPTIDAPRSVRGTGPVTITGTATAGATVTLWAWPLGSQNSDWVNWGTAKAGANGAYSFSKSIAQGYKFKVSAGEDMVSEEVTVGAQQNPVFVATSPSRGVLNLAVQGTPRGVGQAVTVQRWTGRAWATAWTGKTGANNQWRATVKQAPGSKWTLRVLVGSTPEAGILAGYSTNRNVTIR